MKKSAVNGTRFAWNLLVSLLICSVITVIAGVWMNGVPLTGVPKAETVEAVTILCGEQRVELTDPEEIALMVNAANLLNYKPFSAAEDTPALSVTYRQMDGAELTLEASGASVWWKGKAHALHEREIFVDIVSTLYLDLPEVA